MAWPAILPPVPVQHRTVLLSLVEGLFHTNGQLGRSLPGRYSLDEIGSDFIEVDAQEEMYDLLCRLEVESVPPGIFLEHRLTRCGSDEQGRYIIDIETQTKSI